jgi:hypothetical protein
MKTVTKTEIHKTKVIKRNDILAVMLIFHTVSITIERKEEVKSSNILEVEDGNKG